MDDSLLEALFDTMPLQGAWDAARGPSGDDPTVGQLAKRISHTRTLKHPMLTVKANMQDFLKAKSNAARPLLWGYDAQQSLTEIKNVTCISGDRDLDTMAMRFTVFDSVRFGYSPDRKASSFTSKIAVRLADDTSADPNKGTPLELSLDDKSHLVTFCTRNTHNSAGFDPDLWPLEGRHDAAFLRVFLFDVVPNQDGKPTAVSYSEAGIDVSDFFDACKILEDAEAARLAGEPPDERDANEEIFDDHILAAAPSQTPTGTVPSTVPLGATLPRIVVVCSFTPHLWALDFAPGKLAGMARVYPHVMVLSTRRLKQVHGGVYLSRPASNTMIEHAGDGMMMEGMDEMTGDLGSLFTTEANAGNYLVNFLVGGPLVVWANIFDYYVVDPAGTNSPVQGRTFHVVKRGVGPRPAEAVVNRDCTSITTNNPFHGNETLNSLVHGALDPTPYVVKVARQGEFDNLHIAQRMKVTLDLKYVEAVGSLTKVPFPGTAALHMDSIAMAPFCVHDCFHLHFRWTNNGVTGDKGVYGWDQDQPCTTAGQPLVPWNQDVYVATPTGTSVAYMVTATGVDPFKWQPILHQGAAYALTVNAAVAGLSQLELAKRGKDNFYRALPSFQQAAPDIEVGKDWALFYWRLRYYLAPAGNGVVAKERFRFTNLIRALEL